MSAPNFIETLRRDRLKRERLFATVPLLGTFAVLPLPMPGLATDWLVALSALWLLSGALTWAAYFRPNWIAGLWLASFFLSAFLFWKHSLLLPLVLLVLWAVWQGLRSRRMEVHPRKLSLIIGFTLATVAQAQNPQTAGSYALPGATAGDPSKPTAENAPPVTSIPPEGSQPMPTESNPSVSPPTSQNMLPPDIVEQVDPAKEKEVEERKKREATNAALTPPTDVKLNREQRKRRDEAIREFRRSREELKSAIPKAADYKKEEADDQPRPPTADKVVIPKYMNGYKMNDINSCAVVDRIPWRFRPDQRKTRLIIKDYLRYQNQTKFYNWEVYQVMDRQGFISYIIRRPLSRGRYESLVVKDTVYNRLIDDPKTGPRIIENQDLKTLINRETLVFYHADGSTVSYLPSSIGNSVLTIQPASQTGRQLAPIFLRGGICDRPSDISDEDAVQKRILNDRKQAPNTAPPAAGAGVK